MTQDQQKIWMGLDEATRVQITRYVITGLQKRDRKGIQYNGNQFKDGNIPEVYHLIYQGG